MSDESKSPILTGDPQDPLPESNWFFRRWFLFGGGALLIVLKVYETYMDRQDWMTSMLLMTIIICYAIAPSAEQATKMLATASMFKAGVKLKQEKTTTESPHQVSSTTTTEVNKDVGQQDPTRGGAVASGGLQGSDGSSDPVAEPIEPIRPDSDEAPDYPETDHPDLPAEPPPAPVS